jgi:hypothetical protein
MEVLNYYGFAADLKSSGGEVWDEIELTKERRISCSIPLRRESRIQS